MADTRDLQSLHKEFLTFLAGQKRANATILAYGKDIDQLVKFLTNAGRTQASEITKDDLDAFTGKLTKDGYTPKSVSRKINSIKTFYRFLKNNGFVSLNPATEIRHPKYDTKPPRVLSKMEYRALRDATRGDVRTYAIVELFLQTGVRIGELAQLTIVDIQEKELMVKDTNGSSRSVPLNKAAKQALDSYIAIRPKTQNATLFVTKSGKPLLIRNIRTTIDRFFRVAGIVDAKINDLRHTFIAHHLAAGTPITTISKIVGHKRVSTTEKYLNLVKEQERENVKLEEL
ncbi:tyrosine-type recombinase/integrase [Candidatus Gottesmanbacteria bacterium]|nr:tyrosine-type recombinase/integrase [Candidatus Gottesmanbacteria bacterium]